MSHTSQDQPYTILLALDGRHILVAHIMTTCSLCGYASTIADICKQHNVTQERLSSIGMFHGHHWNLYPVLEKVVNETGELNHGHITEKAAKEYATKNFLTSDKVNQNSSHHPDMN